MPYQIEIKDAGRHTGRYDVIPDNTDLVAARDAGRNYRLMMRSVGWPNAEINIVSRDTGALVEPIAREID